MSKKREYDEEYKVQAIKFAKNLGSAKAAAEANRFSAAFIKSKLFSVLKKCSMESICFSR